MALWLSRFVLPNNRSNVIRPETFVMAGFLVQGKRVAIAPAVLASIYCGLGAVAQEKLGPGQCNAEFPVHDFYAWLDQYFPRLYRRLPLPDLGKLKDYVP